MNKQSKTGTFLLCVFLGMFLLLGFGELPGAVAAPAKVAAPSILAAPAMLAASARASDSNSFQNFLPSLANNPDMPWWFGPGGGSVVTVAADPRDPNIAYAGTNGAGVYKSMDGGQSWKATSGMQNLSIDSLAIDPGNTQILYAGSHGQGVYKSTDAGLNWRPVNTGIAAKSVVYTVTVNPGSSAIVYAGTRIQNTLDGVLYQTINGGGNWSPVFTQSEDWIYSIRGNPNEPNRLLAAAHEHGPYYATNYGGSGDWQPANLTGSACPYEECLKGRAVAFDSRSWTGLAYYATWHGEFFRSTNDGLDEQRSSAGMGGSHIYPNGISVKPGNPDVLYMAVHSGDVAGVLRSSNTGQSWGPAGMYGKTVYTVDAMAGSGDTILAGTYLDGLYRSTDGGVNWISSVSGLTNTQITGMAFAGTSTILSSTIGGAGIYRSNNGGVTWAPYNSGLGDTWINGLVQLPTNPNIIFALTTNAGLRRMDLRTGAWGPVRSLALESEGAQPPSGHTSPKARWEPLDELRQLEGEDQAVPQGDATAMISASLNTLVFAPSNPNIAYLGTEGRGIYASTNGGVTWTQVGLYGGAVRQIVVSPKDPNRLFAATTQNGTVKLSADGGLSWVDVRFGDDSLVVRCLAYMPGNPGTLYAGTNRGVWKLDGTTWIEDGLQNYEVKVLAPNPFVKYMLFAGTDNGPGLDKGGAYFTTDGQNWRVLTGLLLYTPIQSINFNPQDSYRVYIGTVARGAIRVPWGR